jgi:hypothetical protein
MHEWNHNVSLLWEGERLVQAGPITVAKSVSLMVDFALIA